MTSKLDTAGLVEELREIVNWLLKSRLVGHELTAVKAAETVKHAIEALTQAAAPDMEPVAYRWTTSDINGDDWPWTYTGKAGADIHSSHGHTVEPLYSASQLSALQERAEKELVAVSRAIGSVRWMDPPDGGDVSLGEQVHRMRFDLEAAEARVAELEGREAKVDAHLDTALLSADPYRHIRAARAALAHKGEGR